MSNIVIEIVNVSKEVRPTKVAGKTYTLYDVAYKNKSFNDKLEGKKQADFVAKNVANILDKASFGDVFTVEREKDGEYWKWTNLIQGNEAPKQQENMQTSKPNVTPKSTYETAEERAARQVMIVRQSSISNAVAMLAAAGDKKTPINVDTVLQVAKAFESYVLGNKPDQDPFTDFPEDVPV